MDSLRVDMDCKLIMLCASGCAMTENDFRQLETSFNLNIVDFDSGTLTLLCLNMKLLDSMINVSVIYNVLMTLIFDTTSA